jgi:tRNA (guanine37-N1)-methyltransferase
VRFSVVSLFPEIVRSFFETSIMARAVERGLVDVDYVNPRDFARDRHKKVDDEIFGGGAGMLMKVQTLKDALDSIDAKGKRVVYVSPSGRLFNQDYAHRLSREKELVLICGRYEGIDQRIIDEYVSDEISIGDYVLSSGETAALVVIDAVYRLVEGVIKGESLEEESFSSGLLEYPQYTRPAVYDSMAAPEVLLSGHHANIVAWRLRERVKKTLAYRPELLAGDALDARVLKILHTLLSEGE